MNCVDIQKWEKLREELAISRSVLSSTNKTEVLKQLYMDYIKPFEKKWEKVYNSEIPSTSDIFRSKKPKLSVSTYHHYFVIKQLFYL